MFYQRCADATPTSPTPSLFSILLGVDSRVDSLLSKQSSPIGWGIVHPLRIHDVIDFLLRPLL